MQIAAWVFAPFAQVLLPCDVYQQMLLIGAFDFYVRQEVFEIRKTLAYNQRDCLFHAHKMAELLKRLIAEYDPNNSPGLKLLRMLIRLV